MGEQFIQLPPNSTGLKLRTRERTVGANTIEEQYVLPTTEEVVSFRGRSCSFRMPGRAGTTGQKIAAIWNAAGSAVLVKVGEVRVDVTATAAKVVLQPVVRIHRITAIPASGTAGPKTGFDSALSSNASVTTYQDASADGTSSATALTITIPANSMLAQEFAPRVLTLVGYEAADRMAFLESGQTVLRAGEGLAVFLDYTLATANPTSDMWTTSIDWIEYTLP